LNQTFIQLNQALVQVYQVFVLLNKTLGELSPPLSAPRPRGNPPDIRPARLLPLRRAPVQPGHPLPLTASALGGFSGQEGERQVCSRRVPRPSG